MLVLMALLAARMLMNVSRPTVNANTTHSLMTAFRSELLGRGKASTALSYLQCICESRRTGARVRESVRKPPEV